ncbi:MAG: ribose-phosphate diphosphokinase [Hyphomicrobiaceae bacterium]
MSSLPDFQSNKEPFEVVFSPWLENLARRIINRLIEQGVQVSYSKMQYTTFSSGEIRPDVPQTVRGKHVYFLHDLQAEDPNIALMRYLLSADALTRSDVASITCVFPNLPYLRQDRREPDERASISAAVVLRLIEESSPRLRTIITYHMHAAQETGFVRLPIANLPGYVDHIRHLKAERGEALADAVIAAPDLGASKYARRIRKAIGSHYQIAIVDKERDQGGTRPLDVIGEPVRGRRVVMFDDIIDTGGSIIGAATRILAEGALDVELRVTHGLFNGDAIDKFRRAGLRVVMLETVSRPPSFHASERSWLTILPIDEMLSSAMHQTMQVGGSVSQLVR